MRAILIALCVLLFCLPVAAKPLSVFVPDGTCDFHGTTSPAFGLYDPSSSIATVTTGEIDYQCNKVATLRISLATGASGSFAQRKMLGPSGALAYNLYLDAARTMIWGDGTGGSQQYRAVGPPNDSPQSVLMYGAIPPRQNVGAGVYTDVLVVTIDF